MFSQSLAALLEFIFSPVSSLFLILLATVKFSKLLSNLQAKLVVGSVVNFGVSPVQGKKFPGKPVCAVLLCSSLEIG